MPSLISVCNSFLYYLYPDLIRRNLAITWMKSFKICITFCLPLLLVMQDPRDSAFVEVLRQNYGKSPGESKHPHSLLGELLKVFWFSGYPSHSVFLLSKNIDFPDGGALVEHRVPERKSTPVLHQPAMSNPNAKSNDAKNGRSDKISPRQGETSVSLYTYILHQTLKRIQVPA